MKNKQDGFFMLTGVLLTLVLIFVAGDVSAADSSVVIDKPIGDFANSLTALFFSALDTVLRSSVYYRFCVALGVFAVFWYIGRMYFMWNVGDIESGFKFLCAGGLMIFVVAYFSIGRVYLSALSDFVHFIHGIGNSIQQAFIGTKDISASAEYIDKIRNSIIWDDSDLAWYDFRIRFTLTVMSFMAWLLVALAHFHSLFADIFIYVMAVVGPLCIPLSLIQKLDKIFDGWLNGMISAFFYYFFVRIILSITVMIVGLGYLPRDAYMRFLINGVTPIEPIVVKLSSDQDTTGAFLFFFVALMAMFSIRSFVSTMVGASGMSGLAGGIAGMGMLRAGKMGFNKMPKSLVLKK